MTKPSLVLLHGVGLDHTMWEPVVALLERELGSDVEILTPDLPGHGRRDRVAAGVGLADLAAGLIDEIPPGSHVVGFSLGALIAQHLAVNRPDLVATLTSVSSVCRRTPPEREAVLARLHMAETDFAGTVEASLRRWYDGADVAEELVQRTEAVLLANDRASFRACYRVFATADAEIGPELGRITQPALAVTGADDPGSTPAMTRRLAEAIPGCRAVVVPAARHMLPVQDPPALTEALTAFIGDNAHEPA